MNNLLISLRSQVALEGSKTLPFLYTRLNRLEESPHPKATGCRLCLEQLVHQRFQLVTKPQRYVDLADPQGIDHPTDVPVLLPRRLSVVACRPRYDVHRGNP